MCGFIQVELFIIISFTNQIYDQTSNVRCPLVGKKIVDHSDVFGASPGGAVPITSSFST